MNPWNRRPGSKKVFLDNKMGLMTSFRVWYELCVRDFIRQHLEKILGDRAAAYCPEDSFEIPPDMRSQRLKCASISSDALNRLRIKCREQKVTFHALLSAALLLAYSRVKAQRNPPKPFSKERIIRAIVLFIVAVVATLTSATGSNKLINYLCSFLGIFAGVMAVYKMTELPAGFVNITTESQMLLNTETGRRCCSGRVITNLDANSKLWEIAQNYNNSFQEKWVSTEAGFELSKTLSLLAVVNNNDSSDALPWMAKFRRVILRLDRHQYLQGGRTLGLACRQVPLVDQDNNQINFDYQSSSKLPSLKDWIIHPSSISSLPHAVKDEASLGVGFALYYSTGPVTDITDQTQSAAQKQWNALSKDRSLSLTLGYIGWGDDQKTPLNSSIDAHASTVLDLVTTLLNQETEAPNGDKSLQEAKKIN